MMQFGQVLFCALLTASAVAADDTNWPQFRGPRGDGASASAGLPLRWSEQQNARWKTAIHGRAWSSPVVWRQQVWLTTATENGRELFAISIDAATGRIVQDLKLFEVEKPQFAHQFNTYASPTPVIEAGRVYVTFGSPGTACLDTRTGTVLWERRDLVCNHFRGAGSSPILFGDLLIMNFDGSDFQFVIALDKKTGKTVWKTNRSIDYKDLQSDGTPLGDGDFRKAFATPQVIQCAGRPVLLSSGAKAHYGYDPLTGRELWRVEERGQHSASSRPIANQDLAFFTTGYSKSELIAVKLGGTGLLDAAHIAWRQLRGAPNKPSLLLDGELLYMIDDSGIASCVGAATGKEVWRERVEGAYSASPLLAGGRIYLCSESGKVAVLAAAREFKLLAENNLADGLLASPAVSGNALFLRTKTHLYRVEK
jgi:outer membrane protein assembly factor BamB